MDDSDHTKVLRAIISREQLDQGFANAWYNSGVEETYIGILHEMLDNIAEHLRPYNPGVDVIPKEEYFGGIQMLVYTFTERLAQLCAGGMFWRSTDKARFLCPIVDVEAIIRSRTRMAAVYPKLIRAAVSDFLHVSDTIYSWFEAMGLDKKQVSYLLWAAKRALRLLEADERIPGFTDLALTDEQILDGFCRCESPIESILYMQMVMDGLRPPTLQLQFRIERYRVDFAIPDGHIVIECDGEEYHQDLVADYKRDTTLDQGGWTVLRFKGKDIIRNPRKIVEEISGYYPIPGYG